MKLFTILILLSSLLFASGHKKIGVIPANINYSNELAQEFSEILYDTISNAIAGYNFSQGNSNSMYYVSETAMVQRDGKRVKEILTPSEIFQKEIKSAHKKIEKDYVTFMKKRKLQKVLVMDFGTKQAAKVINNCKRSCKIKISFTEYSLYEQPKHTRSSYKYDGRTCLLLEESTQKINQSMQEFLSN